jgi:hypothetical protein
MKVIEAIGIILVILWIALGMVTAGHFIIKYW